MAFRTGGGTVREGRGKGIHWHVENDIEYIATDDPHLEQEIPWVRVTYADIGRNGRVRGHRCGLAGRLCRAECRQESRPWIAPPATTASLIPSRRRIKALDDAMALGAISPDIPYFKKNALAVFERPYPNMDEADTRHLGLERLL